MVGICDVGELSQFGDCGVLLVLLVLRHIGEAAAALGLLVGLLLRRVFKTSALRRHVHHALLFLAGLRHCTVTRVVGLPGLNTL